MNKTIPLFFCLLTLSTAQDLKENEASPAKISGLPALGSATETGIQLGALLMYFFPKDAGQVNTSNFGFAFLASLKNQWRFVAFPDIYFDENTHYSASLEYQYWPTDFYGLGNQTKVADKETYLSNNLTFSGNFDKQLHPGLWTGLSYRFFGESIEWDHIEVPENYPIKSAYGDTQNGLGFRINWDQRDHHNYPRSGYQIIFNSLAYEKWLGSDQQFYEFETQAKGFLPLFNEAALGLSLSYKSSQGDVPFRRLSSPNGSTELRGVSNGRYRDLNLVASTLEFRTPIAWDFGLVSFLDLAQVSPSFQEIAMDEMHYSPGLGIRYAFNPADKYNVRADFSFVDGKDFGMTINVKESF